MAEGKTVVLDTGPLIELCDKRGAARALAWLQEMRRFGVVAVVPASVATEFLQGAPDQTRAAWWLSQLDGLDLTFEGGRAAGALAHRAASSRRSASATDAQVVYHAVALDADILTSDPADIESLVAVCGWRVAVHSLP